MATAKESTLTLTRLSVHRKGLNPWEQANPESPFRATVELEGATGKVELNLSEDLSKRIVEIVASEVAAAGRATAEAMVADAMLVQADKKPELTAPVSA